jgi:hypothetical protein
MRRSSTAIQQASRTAVPAQRHAEAAGLGGGQHTETPRRQRRAPGSPTLPPARPGQRHAPVRAPHPPRPDPPAAPRAPPRSRRQDRLDAGAVRTSHHPGVGGRGSQLTRSRRQRVPTRWTAARIAAHHRTPRPFANGEDIHQVAPGPLPGPAQARAPRRFPDACRRTPRSPARRRLRHTAANSWSSASATSAESTGARSTRATTPTRSLPSSCLRASTTKLFSGWKPSRYGTISTTSAANAAAACGQMARWWSWDGRVNTTRSLRDRYYRKLRPDQICGRRQAVFDFSTARHAGSGPRPPRAGRRPRRLRSASSAAPRRRRPRRSSPGVLGDHPEERRGPLQRDREVAPIRAGQHRVRQVGTSCGPPSPATPATTSSAGA